MWRGRSRREAGGERRRNVASRRRDGRMSFFEQLKLLHPGWRDVLEIAIVGYAVYRVLLVLHRTRAMQVLVGLVVLAAVFGGSLALGLGMIVYLLGEVFKYAAFALIVVFAPELRAALAQI